VTLDDLGLNARYLVAGFAGGVVHAIAFKQTEPVAVIGSVLAGMLTANFLAPVASHYVGSWLGEGGSAFVVGLTAMAICQGLLAIVSARINGNKARNKTEAPP